LTKRISAPGLLVQIFVLEESVHDTQCVVSLQHSCNRSPFVICVNITMFSNHTLAYLSLRVIPNVLSKSPETIVICKALLFHNNAATLFWAYAVYFLPNQPRL